jgi:hypothetical protein
MSKPVICDICHKETTDFYEGKPFCKSCGKIFIPLITRRVNKIDASTWPEQEAVEAWIKKYEIRVSNEAKLELKEAVTRYRLQIQEEWEDERLSRYR